MTAIRIPDRSHLEDLSYERERQRLVDAEVEGYRVGQLGLGAGLCPQYMTPEEQTLWRLGHQRATYARMRRRVA